MPITLDEPRGPGTPVVKRTALGQTLVGALVKTQQRDVLKDSQPVLKDNGKARQELVVTLLVMPGTTAPAGIGDTVASPDAGDTVRLILRGKSFADWLEAKRGLGRGLQVGDVVEQTTDHGQVYSASGTVEGPKLTTQAQVDAVPRSKSLGIYGPLSIRPATPGAALWVTAAEAASLAAARMAAAAPAVAANAGGDW